MHLELYRTFGNIGCSTIYAFLCCKCQRLFVWLWPVEGGDDKNEQAHQGPLAFLEAFSLSWFPESASQWSSLVKARSIHHYAFWLMGSRHFKLPPCLEERKTEEERGNRACPSTRGRCSLCARVNRCLREVEANQSLIMFASFGVFFSR